MIEHTLTVTGTKDGGITIGDIEKFAESALQAGSGVHETVTVTSDKGVAKLSVVITPGE